MMHSALKAWDRLGPFDIEPIPIGLINQTYCVTGPSQKLVLQKLHPIFAPTVNQDIDAVTGYLQKAGLLTPTIVPTDEGGLWTMIDEACWRMQTFVNGVTFDRLHHADMAKSAGNLVGRFHAVMFDFQYTYQFTRSNVHDTASYVRRLETAIDHYKNHAWYDKVARQADLIFDVTGRFPDLSTLPRRNSHGDLKISNVLFDDAQQAICLLDLDTLGKMSWPIEMGDAFRSWCNPSGENREVTGFHEGFFESAIKGYASACKHLWTREEVEALWFGMQIIPVELSTRFLLDVLEDKYWGWDSERYNSRAEHNWVRSMGQWSLYQDIEQKSKCIREHIKRAFSK